MEKKNVWLIIVVIVLSLLVVILGGYVLFDSVLSDKDGDNILITEDGEFVNENTENSYSIFANNLKNKISGYDINNNNALYVKSDIISDGYEVYVDNNSDLFIKYYDK